MAGKITIVRQDTSSNIAELENTCEIIHRFECSWCHTKIDITDEDTEQAAKTMHEVHYWRECNDDDQVGICCQSCFSRPSF